MSLPKFSIILPDMREAITNYLNGIVQEQFGLNETVEMFRPDPAFGDFSTNIALKLAGKLNKSPRAIAEAISADFKHDSVVKCEVAEPVLSILP